ncbi:MAG: phage major capsid protein [Granulicatella sp.]|nr:MAG: phage major capsid protein [Granulicatella sp.]
MTESNALQTGTLFKPELVKELISKVKGESVLAQLSKQTPIPFNGTEQFIFSLEGDAQIVGEGKLKGAGKASLDPKIIKPLKFVYQARISDEFMKSSEEKQIEYMSLFADGFAKKIAQAFDIAALHGLEPKTLTDASFKATNSFDGLVTTNIVTYTEAQIDSNIEDAIQAVIATDNDVTGIAMSPVAARAMSKIKNKNEDAKYSQFSFGGKPTEFADHALRINKNLTKQGGSSEKDHVIVGDFENLFKWGYAENMPLEIIQFGDPDGTGRDLKAYNEICLRAEAFIGWGILDATAFARVKEA